jgi:four helix bundle protein
MQKMQPFDRLAKLIILVKYRCAMRKFDLEERLIDFAAKIIQIFEGMPRTGAGGHLRAQLLRSGTSAALNYGEALGGESRNDFIHKLRVSLKELRETFNCLRIIQRAGLFHDQARLENVLKENNELIAIFVKSSLTAEKNKEQGR